MRSIIIRPTQQQDWQQLKQIRLNALLDSLEAFSLRYADVIKHDDVEWQKRAAQRTSCYYFLAFHSQIMQLG